MDEIKANVASNLIKLRATAGMTQSDLGEKLNYSDKAVSKWERAESLPDVGVLKKIADLFGVTVDYLITSHDQWEINTQKIKKERHYSTTAITWISLVGILTAAVLLFVIFWMFGSIQWQIFVYMMVPALITTLVLNSIWNKRRGNIFIVSALVLSIFTTIFTAFYTISHTFIWMLFLVAIPAEIVVVLAFNIKKKNKK